MITKNTMKFTVSSNVNIWIGVIIISRLNVMGFVAPMGRITHATSSNLTETGSPTPSLPNIVGEGMGAVGNAIGGVVNAVSDVINSGLENTVGNVVLNSVPNNVTMNDTQINALQNFLTSNNLTMAEINGNATTLQRSQARVFARERGIADELALAMIYVRDRR